MAYTDATQVTITLPRGITVTGSSVPISLTEVTDWITGVDAEINAAAAQAGYEVPIAATSSQSFSLLQMHSRERVQADILGVLSPGLPTAKQYRDAYDAFIRALRKGELPLVDAPSDTDGGARELPRSNVTTFGVPSPIMPLEKVW